MKKALLSLGIVSILFLGTNNVFAAPMQPNHQMKAPQKIEKQQPPKQNNRIAHSTKNVAPTPKHHVAPAPKRHVAPAPKHTAYVAPKPHNVAPPPPQRVAYTPYAYNNGFALKIGNFFLSI